MSLLILDCFIWLLHCTGLSLIHVQVVHFYLPNVLTRNSWLLFFISWTNLLNFLARICHDIWDSDYFIPLAVLHHQVSLKLGVVFCVISCSGCKTSQVLRICLWLSFRDPVIKLGHIRREKIVDLLVVFNPTFSRNWSVGSQLRVTLILLDQNCLFSLSCWIYVKVATLARITICRCRSFSLILLNLLLGSLTTLTSNILSVYKILLCGWCLIEFLNLFCDSGTPHKAIFILISLFSIATNS